MDLNSEENERLKFKRENTGSQRMTKAEISDEDFSNGFIYPAVKDILKVSVNVAIKIAEEIFNSGLAGVEKPNDIREFITSRMYEPVYK